MKKTLNVCFGRRSKLKPYFFGFNVFRLHPKFHVPRPSGSALQVCEGGNGGGWVGGCVNQF